MNYFRVVIKRSPTFIRSVCESQLDRQQQQQQQRAGKKEADRLWQHQIKRSEADDCEPKTLGRQWSGAMKAHVITVSPCFDTGRLT